MKKIVDFQVDSWKNPVMEDLGENYSSFVELKGKIADPSWQFNKLFGVHHMETEISKLEHKIGARTVEQIKIEAHPEYAPYTNHKLYQLVITATCSEPYSQAELERIEKQKEKKEARERRLAEKEVEAERKIYEKLKRKFG